MIYFVATPIGNLKDITFRAIETLKNADVIFCEDTRHTVKLLNAYEIKKPLFACHKFNEREAAEKILTAARDGKEVAVVSDAGTPVISCVEFYANTDKRIRSFPARALFCLRSSCRRCLRTGSRLSGFCPIKRAKKRRFWRSIKNSTVRFCSIARRKT